MVIGLPWWLHRCYCRGYYRRRGRHTLGCPRNRPGRMTDAELSRWMTHGQLPERRKATPR